MSTAHCISNDFFRSVSSFHAHYTWLVLVLCFTVLRTQADENYDIFGERTSTLGTRIHCACVLVVH